MNTLCLNFQERFARLREIKSSTTWIQGVGAHYGKPAGELQKDDVIVWNFGTTTQVLKIMKETKTLVEVYLFEPQTWKSYKRRLKKNRIVAIEGAEVANVTKEELRYVR